MERLSLRTARRVALAAQGFADPRPTGAVDRRHLKRVVGRTGLLQVDSVNVFERAHHLPLFSRLGPYDRELLPLAAYRHRDLFEYWGHEASLLPVSTHPLLRWRMEQAARLELGWGRVTRVARERPDVVTAVLQRITDGGPATAGELHTELDGGARPAGPWWDWSLAKVALEQLFWSGRVTTSTRRGFTRVYDLPERVLPAAVLALPTPSPADAQRELVRLAARSHGVATEADLRDYYRLKPDETRRAVADLVESGDLLPVTVEGWRSPAYLSAGSRVPRRVRASALLSPFDPLVWYRDRTARLFGFDYRIEIYVPAPKRVHGYYVLPFLHAEALRARVDLKSDRQAGVLRVLASWLEPGSDPGDTAAALAAELERAAAWQGLSAVLVEPRGDLAPALAAAVT
ncbi:MAG: winged helix DNA-binding domain-containing protein [Frankiaceae bacterium]|nr:winged helix DNA-binding domain-containing protein [Frankiaceae bacterium]